MPLNLNASNVNLDFHILKVNKFNTNINILHPLFHVDLAWASQFLYGVTAPFFGLGDHNVLPVHSILVLWLDILPVTNHFTKSTTCFIVEPVLERLS